MPACPRTGAAIKEEQNLSAIARFGENAFCGGDQWQSSGP